VTHHRLETQDGKLVPAAPLESPLAVRPTSEAMITPALNAGFTPTVTCP